MATEKTWTAADVVQGMLKLEKTQDTQGNWHLLYDRQYRFVDAATEVLADIPARRWGGSIPVANIPVNILTALQTIDTWTYNKILEIEGMQD